MKKFLPAVVVWFLALATTGCVSVPQSLSANVLYARALQMVINGRPAVGTAVVPLANRYRIEIKSSGAMDLLLIKSCHREWWGEKLSSGGWFNKESKYIYEYIPDSALEREECPLTISAYDAKRTIYAWGYIDFEEPFYALPATLECNGTVNNFTGVSICQSRKGLVQAVHFPVDVIAKPDKGCEIVSGKEFVEGKDFTFQIAEGSCYYVFMEKGQPRRKHRLTTIGYSDIVIQEQ